MKQIIINVSPLETRIALLEHKRLTELNIERLENRSVVGNIYKGRVENVVPGMQAAFVDIGFEKNGFLYVSDVAGIEGTTDVVLENGVPRQKSRKSRSRRPIESLLKAGQHIMVQVMKDQIGTKGPRLTNYITLPGRYVVLMPTVTHLGVSRKIDSGRERDRLKRILTQARPKGLGLITRTAGEGRTKNEIEDDVKFLMKVWNKVKNKYDSVKGHALLREDLGPVLRVVRDQFGNDVDRLVVDSDVEYSRILNFLETFAPNLRKRVRLYRAKRPIFDKMGIEEEIDKAMHRKVFLKSGGHICIDPTEALIAIDVNTGKFTGKKQLEDTVLQTNLEAAQEIARQVRLRDLGGIIVIDFIDMQYEKNRRELLRTLTEALKQDRAKNTISEVNELGMVELTRKRVKHNLLKALSQTCPYCEGSGMVRSVTTVTFDVLRQLESLFCTTKESRIILQCNPDVARRLRHENKDLIDAVGQRFDREIIIESVSDFHVQDTKFLRARNRQVMTP
ncbi:MAG: ribonuclease E/G [Candidatus Hydrogenedentota bacterium]